MKTPGSPRTTTSGITLLEVVFAIVALSIFARVAIMKLQTPATLTLHTQAQALAEQVRRAQTLAVAQGQRTRVSVASSGANGSIAVACAASSPCVTDSTYTAAQGAAVGVNNTVLYFNSLGLPVNSVGVPLSSDFSFALSYTTGSTTATYTVTVAALTGRVSISP